MPEIMVVDDDLDFLEVISRFLHNKGYKVIKASGGKECLELLERVRPDLILLDIMMPEMDGYEVCKTIKEHDGLKDIKIMMLTAKSGDMDRIKSLDEAMADWHITKPVDGEKLLGMIDWILQLPAINV
jgi:CheY-like chemotaxis protein